MGEVILRERAASHIGRPPLGYLLDSALSSGGLLAALATSACCLIPFVLFPLGITGAWIGDLAAMESFQPVSFAVSAAMICLGFLRVRSRSRPSMCRPGTPCADLRAGRLMKAAL